MLQWNQEKVTNYRTDAKFWCWEPTYFTCLIGGLPIVQNILDTYAGKQLSLVATDF
jgi:hypothetical protein